MKPLDSDEDEEQLAVYQKTLRERANRSIQQLSSALAARSPDGEETGAVRSPLSFMAGEEQQAAWSQRTQSQAVNQLRSLLEKQQKETHSPLSPSKKKSPPKRTQEEGMAIQDLIPMIYNQSEYIQHLEAQVKFCTEELEGMKQRVRVVVVENEKLQSDLKNTTLAQMVNECPATNLAHNPTEALTWQDKLEQLKVMHQAQTETLESQVVSLRKELSVSQKECEEVKDRLRRREVQAAEAAKAGSAPRVAGLCLKCAQHEAVLAGTHTNVHVQAIERLTKERDELMAALCAGRVSQQESQQREWSACLQVKQAVEMAEEFKLQKTRVRLTVKEIVQTF